MSWPRDPNSPVGKGTSLSLPNGFSGISPEVGSMEVGSLRTNAGGLATLVSCPGGGEPLGISEEETGVSRLVA